MKRTTIGGSVVLITGLLVLSAISVAQRDSRNASDSEQLVEPEYAMQAIEPLAMGMSSEDSTNSNRQFPDPSLAMEPSLQQAGNELANQSTPVSSFVRTVPGSNSNPLREDQAITYVSNDAVVEDSMDGYEPDSMIDQEVQSSEQLQEAADIQEVTSADEEQFATIAVNVNGSGGKINPAGYGLLSPGQSPQASNANGGLQPPPLPSFNASATSTPTATTSSSAVPSQALPPTAPAPNLELPSRTNLASPPAQSGLPLPNLPLPSTSAASTRSNTLEAPLDRSVLTNSSSQADASYAPSDEDSETMALPTLNQSVPPASNEQAYQPRALETREAAATEAAVSANPSGLAAPVNSNAMSRGMNLPNAAISAMEPIQRPETTPPQPMSLTSVPPTIAASASNGPSNTLPTAEPRNTTGLGRLASVAVPMGLTSERPGERAFDGAQQPSLQIQKQAPQEIQVGRPATFTILVKNTGAVPARGVTVQDAIPDGTELLSTQPQAQVTADKRLVWDLGEMAAGGQQMVTMEIRPLVEGEIGSVATVHFAAMASVRTVSTQPKLTITQTTDPSVLIGESAQIRISVANEGTGVAYDVNVEELIPHGFKHPGGNKLGTQLGDLSPGQIKAVTLDIEATEPGQTQNIIGVKSSNADPVSSTIDIEVVSPQLAVKIDGPGLRYLERQAKYVLAIENTGTALARNVELQVALPPGVRFNSAGNQGEYISDKHAVIWTLNELPANSIAKTDLIVMPIQDGNFVMRAQTRSDKSVSEPIEKPIQIQGQSELAFSIEDDNDPIETDGETTYAVRITNIGTRGDSNVQVFADLPSGAEVVQVSAPVDYQVQGNHLVFQPIPSMASKEQQLLRFTLRLAEEGTQVVRVSVKSEMRPIPVSKEEGTVVYFDQ